MRNAVWALLAGVLVFTGCAKREQPKQAEPMAQPNGPGAAAKPRFALHITPPPGWVPLDRHRIGNPEKDSVIYFTMSTKKPLKLLGELLKALRDDGQKVSDVTADADGKGGWYTIVGVMGEDKVGKGIARQLSSDPPLTLFAQGGWPPALDREMTPQFDAIIKSIWLERK